MWFMAVYLKAWLLHWNIGSSLSLREEDSSLRSGSTRLRQLLHGMGSISHRFTTLMDQWRTKFHCQTEGSKPTIQKLGRRALLHWPRTFDQDVHESPGAFLPVRSGRHVGDANQRAKQVEWLKVFAYVAAL